MGQESVTYSLANYSPLVTYLPSVVLGDGVSGSLQREWQARISGDSILYVTSLPLASVIVEFYGSAISFFGNSTCALEVTVDTETVRQDAGADPTYQVQGLRQTTHTLNVTALATQNMNPELTVESFFISYEFDSAQPLTSTNYTAKDNVVQSHGVWTTASDGSISTTSSSASISLTFVGFAVAVNGPVGWNQTSGSLSVELDEVQSSYEFPPIPEDVPPTQMFYQGGLDPTGEHLITLSYLPPAGQGMPLFTIDSFTVWQLPASPNASSQAGQAPATLSGSALPGTTQSPPSSGASGISGSSTRSHKETAEIVGPVASVVCLAVLGAIIWMCVRRRRRQWPSRAVEKEKDKIIPYPPLLASTSAPSKGNLASNARQPTPVPSSSASQPATSTFGSAVGAPDPLTIASPAAPLQQIEAAATRYVASHRSASPSEQSQSPAPQQPPQVVGGLDVNRIIEIIAQRIDSAAHELEMGRDAAPPRYPAPSERGDV
ncbi:hypothetical protein OBBRIDRAFT_241977 [Obba rivulosa]|uniref:Uncharacterized protein n=1 Tax=Obba rivulosa TaxID=1052685 RepID=A0A8E2AQT5_9APHY|nr:hypothetical protein OBBRIDRAFT_241977 [Obba rivulosa]